MIKKSFVLHIDSLDVLDDLDDEQAGQLFKAIKAYQKDNDIALNSLLNIAFSPFKNQFIRDDEKYRKTCERRAEAGSRGGKQKVANASNCKQNVANVADKDSKKKKKKDKEELETVDYSVLKITDDEIAEVKRIRKSNKGGSLSQRSVNGLAKQFSLAKSHGFSIDAILTEWDMREWKSFKAEWIIPKTNLFNPQQPVNKPRAFGADR